MTMAQITYRDPIPFFEDHHYEIREMAQVDGVIGDAHILGDGSIGRDDLDGRTLRGDEFRDRRAGLSAILVIDQDVPVEGNGAGQGIPTADGRLSGPFDPVERKEPGWALEDEAAQDEVTAATGAAH